MKPTNSLRRNRADLFCGRIPDLRGGVQMTTKPCETCGKLLIGVKGDRRFCNACAIRRRKAYQKSYRENRKKR